MYSGRDRLAGQSVPALRDQVPLEEEEEEREDETEGESDRQSASCRATTFEDPRSPRSDMQGSGRDSEGGGEWVGSGGHKRGGLVPPVITDDNKMKSAEQGAIEAAEPRDEIEDELYPPKNFAMVYQGVFRSAYPTKKNFDFLKKLGLKSVVYLCQEEYSPKVKQFYEQNNVTVKEHGVSGNKEPFVEISEEQIRSALEVVLDVNNHPVLIHCNQGKHRTGSLVGCLRAINHWSMAAIFEEYRRFAGSKARRADMQFIELFHRKYPQVKTNPKFHPPWFLG